VPLTVGRSNVSPALGRLLVTLATGFILIAIALVFDATGTLSGRPWVFGVATMLAIGLALAIYERKTHRDD